MNGKKILNRLIYLFLGINILLFICNGVIKYTEYQLSQSRITNINGVLKDRGITLEGQLPRSFEPKWSATLSYLGDDLRARNDLVKAFFSEDWARVLRSTSDSKSNMGAKVKHFTLNEEQLSFDKSKITYSNNEVEIKDNKPTLSEARDIGEAFIARLGQAKEYDDAYIEAEEKEESWHLKYYPRLEGYPVFDLYIELWIYKTGVKEATIYLGLIEVEKLYDIYPIDLVLFGIEKYIPLKGEKVIKQITIGYKKLEKQGGNLWGEELEPVYKIDVKGLDYPLFVNAYTNELIK